MTLHSRFRRLNTALLFRFRCLNMMPISRTLCLPLLAAMLGLTQGANAQWQVETISSHGGISPDMDLVLDSADALHLALETNPNSSPGGDLYYWNSPAGGGGWSGQLVQDDAVNFVGDGCDMVLDSAGNPHFSHIQLDDWSYDTYLAYSWFDGVTYQTTQLTDLSVYPETGTQIFLDSSDREHLLWDDWYTGSLMHTWNNGSGYQTEVVATGLVDYPRFEESDSGEWLVAYFHRANYSSPYSVRLSRSTGAAWTEEIVDDSPFISRTLRLDLALDADANPRVVYSRWDSTTNITKELRHAQFDGNAWIIEAIDTDNTYSYWFPSIAVDSFGRSMVAFSRLFTASDRGLSFGIRSASGWILSEVEAVGSGVEIMNTTMAIDSEDQPHIAYHDYISGETRYATHAAFGTLLATPSTISLSAGGVQTFNLLAGSEYAARAYQLIGSSFGSSPGFQYQGYLIPLNPIGSYFQDTLSNSSSVLNNSQGFLDAAGAATATLDIPASSPAALAGTVLHHAFGVLYAGQLQMVSNAVSVELIP